MATGPPGATTAGGAIRGGGVAGAGAGAIVRGNATPDNCGSGGGCSGMPGKVDAAAGSGTAAKGGLGDALAAEVARRVVALAAPSIDGAALAVGGAFEGGAAGGGALGGVALGGIATPASPTPPATDGAGEAAADGEASGAALTAKTGARRGDGAAAGGSAA